MVEPFGSPSSSSSPPFEILPESFHELLESLKDQGVEIGIVMSIQPLSLLPLPSLETRSSANLGPNSLENLIQTPKSSPTTDGHLGLITYPLNP